MIEIKQYWVEDTPKVSDIEAAFKVVKEQNVIVELKWRVPYSGHYGTSVNLEDTQSLSPEEYFEKYIPHIYGV